MKYMFWLSALSVLVFATDVPAQVITPGATSIRAVAEAHFNAGNNLLAKSHVFRFQTFLPQLSEGVWDLDTGISYHAIAGNNLTYFFAEALAPKEFTEQAYSIFHCGGAPMENCGKPTGETEADSLHLAVIPPLKWALDIPNLKLVIKKLGIQFRGQVLLDVRTYGRASENEFLHGEWPETHDLIKAKLENRSIVPKSSLLIMSELIDFNEDNNYLIFDLETGKLLIHDLYKPMPPRPGAVTSGG